MTEKEQIIVIGRRFRGPPASGNGGYVSGVLGKHLSQPAAITLRAPVPIDRPLRLHTDSQDAGEGFVLDDGDDGRRIAEIHPDTLSLSPPTPPDWDTVQKLSATGGSPGNSEFGGCFVCGRSRSKGDGLQVYAGICAHPEHGQISVAPFVPEAEFAGTDGHVAPEYHWAALDCPGAVAVYDGSIMLTGRMTGYVYRPLRAGERATVLGWPMGGTGRKIYSATAIIGENGDYCAGAYSLWIKLKEGHPNYQPPAS